MELECLYMHITSIYLKQDGVFNESMACQSLIQCNNDHNHNQLSKLIPVCNLYFQSCLVFTMSFMFRKGSFTKEEEKRKKEVGLEKSLTWKNLMVYDTSQSSHAL